MDRVFMLCMAVAGLLFAAACDKEEIMSTPMEWSVENMTPESVVCEGPSPGYIPKYYFRANGDEGEIVMTCNNYDVLNPISGNSDTYDSGWATIKVEANQLKIHFPYNTSGAPEVSESITLTANDDKNMAQTIIVLFRTFEKGEQPDPQPEPLPDEAKFKIVQAGFTPLMQLDSRLPAPLDLITFRITDVNDKYTASGFPEFTQYYDSIVWNADGFPHTLRIYESKATAEGSETHLATQWGSHFFKSGTIKNHLKGYRNGKVEYETSLDMTLHERDFMGLDWSMVVLLNPKNPTVYCRLDTDYEYQVNDIVAKDGNPFSKIIPVNHKLIQDSDFPAVARKAIITLMDNNVGEGRSAKGKEILFKCLPDEGMEAELYWENKTSRMLMLHQLANNPDGLAQNMYYLHAEPK